MNEPNLPPTILVIFGITGDLSHRYILPALTEIKQAGKLAESFRIIGISRRDVSTSDGLGEQEHALSDQTDLLKIDLANPEEYDLLKQKLAGHNGQVIYYLAVPPGGTKSIIENLSQAGLNGPNSKLLLEKPFGTDLNSATELIAQTTKSFKEDQIYRIDHYLAKEMAQNIAVFLGSNSLFKNVWNTQFIERIEITAAETLGVEGRGNFYEQTGALRDIIQSHLLQLAALTLMKPCPHDFNFADLPQRRLEALQALRLSTGAPNKDLVRGQYRGYTDDVGNPSSSVETFAALKLESSDPRWGGVPIYLSSGKKLDRKLSQIRVTFKAENPAETNVLDIRVQPNEAVELELWVKQPGYERKLQKKTLSFSYEQNFSERLPDAYEQVLVDVMRGSHSLFATGQEVLASWEILQPALDFWKNNQEQITLYEPGSTIDQILS